MKVIIYSGQNKFTVDNISIPNQYSPSDLLRTEQQYAISATDFDKYNFQITSTRGAVSENEEYSMNEDIEREIEEGINWKLESVN